MDAPTDPFDTILREGRVRRALRRVFARGVPVAEMLALCEACGRDFVGEQSWTDCGDDRWTVRLRCGACGRVRSAKLDGLAVTRLRAALAEGRARVEALADQAAQARMASWADAFSAALERDLIDPDDFRPRSLAPQG